MKAQRDRTEQFAFSGSSNSGMGMGENSGELSLHFSRFHSFPFSFFSSPLPLLLRRLKLLSDSFLPVLRSRRGPFDLSPNHPSDSPLYSAARNINQTPPSFDEYDPSGKNKGRSKAGPSNLGPGALEGGNGNTYSGPSAPTGAGGNDFLALDMGSRGAGNGNGGGGDGGYMQMQMMENGGEVSFSKRFFGRVIAEFFFLAVKDHFLSIAFKLLKFLSFDSQTFLSTELDCFHSF